MLQIKILLIASSAIECLFNESSVVRMRLLNNSRQIRRIRPIGPVDPIGLLRPVDRSAGAIPAETARVAQGLRFGGVGLAPSQGIVGSPTLAVLLLQIRIEVSVFQRDGGLGGEEFQDPAAGGREWAG